MGKLRVLSLFAGIGGFDLGLERTGGFETVAFCEIDGDCQRVLAKHWQGVPIYDDVRELSAQHLTAAGIAVDVICGGFPCQNISLAGRMEGIDGAKSGLWSEYRRLIEEIRPRWVIIENAPTLRSHGLEAMLGELSALGYDAEWHCLPLNAFGAPHRRDRLWIVSYPTGERDGLSPLQISTGWDKSQHRAWWDTEPAVGRVVDAVSAEPHRLRMLGNAVCPAAPFELGRAILAAETESLRMTAPDTEALRGLLAKATQEDLSDGGRYFADSFDDLTRCRHEEIGEYQNRHDGPLVEWLWNHRHQILALLDDRAADKARIGEADKRIRKLEAALRVARGYVLSNASEQSFRDQVTIDAALGIKP